MSTPSQQATAELIARFALAGKDDPSIAVRLGISVSTVRRLRKEFGIPPGETRWLGQPTRG
jgi:DNA-binding NarL/FixJ family response regulator